MNCELEFYEAVVCNLTLPAMSRRSMCHRKFECGWNLNGCFTASKLEYGLVGRGHALAASAQWGLFHNPLLLGRNYLN
jgi:hypothetical protein